MKILSIISPGEGWHNREVTGYVPEADLRITIITTTVYIDCTARIKLDAHVRGHPYGMFMMHDYHEGYHMNSLSE